MNSTITNIDMYKIKPLYDFQPNVFLPSCMYKMRSIYEDTNTVDLMEDSINNDIANYQIQVTEKLEALKEDVSNFKRKLGIDETKSATTKVEESKAACLKVPTTHQDIVIKANPNYPPLSIWAFYNLLLPFAPTQLATYIHSSLTEIPKSVEILSQNKGSLEKVCVTFTIIWKDTEKDPEMMVDPIKQGIIAGEVNIARYLSRLLSYGYEEGDIFAASEIDYWLELIHSSLIHGSNKERNAALKSINSQLEKSNFLGGDQTSLADIVLWSAIVQCDLNNCLPNNIDKWWKIITNLPMFKVPLIVK